ncbi:hypothetical protein [Burkholderia reimsis]|uniref:hypothetical protein n=1 Tax=Burkholderia reimsis TaxID=2234132 RepID=UPI001058ED1F|nr:hypothetical protein [Burkholderia reimsis]
MLFVEVVEPGAGPVVLSSIGRRAAAMPIAMLAHARRLVSRHRSARDGLHIGPAHLHWKIDTPLQARAIASIPSPLPRIPQRISRSHRRAG